MSRRLIDRNLYIQIRVELTTLIKEFSSVVDVAHHATLRDLNGKARYEDPELGQVMRDGEMNFTDPRGVIGYLSSLSAQMEGVVTEATVPISDNLISKLKAMANCMSNSTPREFSACNSTARENVRDLKSLLNKGVFDVKNSPRQRHHDYPGRISYTDSFNLLFTKLALKINNPVKFAAEAEAAEKPLAKPLAERLPDEVAKQGFAAVKAAVLAPVTDQLSQFERTMQHLKDALARDLKSASLQSTKAREAAVEKAQPAPATLTSAKNLNGELFSDKWTELTGSETKQRGAQRAKRSHYRAPDPQQFQR